MLSDMALLLYFGIGRLLFFALAHRDGPFLWTHSIASLCFCLSGLLILRTENSVIRGVLLGGAYVVASVAAMWLAPRHPPEACATTQPDSTHELPPVTGIVDSRGCRLGGPPMVAVGIVEFSWTLIVGGGLSIIGFALHEYPFNCPLPPKGLPPEYYRFCFDTASFLLEKTLDSVFLVGGVLAGCMAILWSGEIWRRGDGPSKRLYFLTTQTAMRMTVAYFLVAIAAFIWIGAPLYFRMVGLADLMR